MRSEVVGGRELKKINVVIVHDNVLLSYPVRLFGQRPSIRGMATGQAQPDRLFFSTCTEMHRDPGAINCLATTAKHTLAYFPHSCLL